jgi:general secretion pathway protein F
MSLFIYKALSSAAADVTGTIAADTPRQAREILRERGLVVRDIADYQETVSKSLGLSRTRRPRSSAYQITIVIRELATLLGVGVPLLEALETVARQHGGRIQQSILLLRDRVSAGTSLASAMREQPAVFNELAINITEVGEDAGTLDTSLERLAEFREKTDQFKNRLATAVIYPLIVSAVGLFSTIFLMTFVVPKIIQPLIDQDLPLPFPTRVVKAGSDFLISWWWILAIVVASASLAVAAVLKTDAGRRRWHRLLLRFPIAGDLVRKQALVHISVVISTLLKSGVMFVRALQIAQRTTSNLVLRDALGRCESAISAGGDIADAMEKTAAFPPTAVQVFSLGQKSGRLEEMLDRLIAAYELQVASASQRLAAILEPAMILILAGVVLFVVLATVLPILEVGNAIQ